MSLLTEAMVTMALLTHLHVGARRASYLSSAIVYAVGDDLGAAAAMIVNLHAETGGLEGYEKCLLVQKQGWGAFGIAAFWENRLPGSTCGPIDVQASAAFRILAWHKYDPAEAFGRYIGATSRERHPEARRRAAFHSTIVWEMEHQACL